MALNLLLNIHIIFFPVNGAIRQKQKFINFYLFFTGSFIKFVVENKLILPIRRKLSNRNNFLGDLYRVFFKLAT